MRLLRRGLLWIVLLSAACLIAQSNSSNAAGVYEAALAEVHFRAIGPAMQGGRIDSITVVEQDPDTFYIGAATGGLWKTTNGGTTFEPLLDTLPALTVGSVAVAPSNPAIVWLGSGEPNNRQSSSWGTGVYESTDSGKTWAHMGLADTQSIGRVVIDPTNPEVVYVAALGHLWGPNAERGLFKTTDGGKTWSKVLFLDEDTGVVDVALDPRSPNVVYAAAYQRRRTPWGFNGGGPGSALYKSTDGGATWRKLTEGLPKAGNLGRIGIAVYHRNPDIIYAIIEGKEGGTFRSEDRGETWRKMSSGLGSPYFSQIRIDPVNDLRVWVLLDFLMSSTDGGKTYTPDMRTNAHWDFHELWMDPRRPGHMLAATDGGVYRTQDGGRNWEFLDTLPLGQIYRLGYDNETPYHICGGFQDNGVLCGPVRTRSAEGIANADWKRVLTGDGFDVQIDPAHPNIIYTESQDGSLKRLDLQSHEWFPIAPKANTGEAPYRFAWEAPLLVSSHTPDTLYFGGNFLFKSTDRGNTWTKLAGDLTTGVDRNKLTILGKLPSADTVSLNYGVDAYPEISAIAESPVDGNVLWAGTQDGNLEVTRDGGRTWTNVAANLPAVPKGTWVSSIAASRAGAGTAYVAFDGHAADDFRSYIVRTTDFGRSWTRVANGIANGGTVHVVREDPGNPNLLFAGTEYGAYASFDRGGSWYKLAGGVPDAPVDDIEVQPREHDLILATHGRSFYVADDIRPLEELTPQVLGSPLHLFSVRPAVSWRLFVSSNGYNGNLYFTAPNPAYGALISYYVSRDLPEVTITIRDQSGALVQQIKGSGKAGLHRVDWDLRSTTHNKPLDLQIWAAQQGFLIYHSLPNLGMPAPLVFPGEYKVEAAGGDAKASTTVEVSDDPHVIISAADRQAHHQLAMQAFELYEQGMLAQKSTLALDAALNTARDNWKKDGVQVPAEVQKPVEALMKELAELHAVISGPRKFDPMRKPATPLIRRLAELLYSLEAETATPTADQRAQFTDLQQALATFTSRLRNATEKELPALNDAIRSADIPYIAVPAAKPSSANEKAEHDR